MSNNINLETKIKKLKDMIEPRSPYDAYFRPFIYRGDLKREKIFIVGTNPATPIYPRDIEIDEFIELINNYEDFMSFYSKNRLVNNKSEISRTRQGIRAFGDWIINNSGKTIIETDIITYPTASIKVLKKQPKAIIEKGKNNFFSILTTFKPKTIILYGKKTVKIFSETIEERNIQLSDKINLKIPIEEYEETVPLTSFSYEDNTICKVFACRHFMYYGKTGKSFSRFRNKLLNYIID